MTDKICGWKGQPDAHKLWGRNIWASTNESIPPKNNCYVFRTRKQTQKDNLTDKFVVEGGRLATPNIGPLLNIWANINETIPPENNRILLKKNFFNKMQKNNSKDAIKNTHKTMIDRQILWWGGTARHPCGHINQLRLCRNSKLHEIRLRIIP